MLDIGWSVNAFGLITTRNIAHAMMNKLSDIRDHYIRCFRSQAREEAMHFALGSPTDRVRNAALARTANGKHRHQWRIPPAVLAKFAERLVSKLSDIASATSFAQLLSVVDSVRIKRIGELTVYDTAVRIGGGQHIEPEEIYLHAGTRKGAARLKWNVKRASIPRSEISPELDGLSAAEVEDLLCIYVAHFGRGAKKLPTGCRNGSKNGCDQKRTRPPGCR